MAVFLATFTGLLALAAARPNPSYPSPVSGRERTNLNQGWRFWRSESNPDDILYDYRPNDTADATLLRQWILPSMNDFVKDRASHHKRPSEPPNGKIKFAQNDYDDDEWEEVDLPHDWAIKGPFYTEKTPIITGEMGRLPVHGVGWYRRELSIPASDKGKTTYLDVDGAMSYSMVWLNGDLVGGWPHGYASYRLDLTPYIQHGGNNSLAIRLDNRPDSSRWYPGAGLYRSVWLTTVERVHVSQWGSHITSREVSKDSATVDLAVEVVNSGQQDVGVEVETEVFVLDRKTNTTKDKVAAFPKKTIKTTAGNKMLVNGSITLDNPRLWGPPPTQKPHLYIAITTLRANNKIVDSYKTSFGIRSLISNPDRGLLVNGDRVPIRGVNLHSDLGALGMAFNSRAAQRQLEILKEMGTNAIRLAHNIPAVELLDMADQMGFLVLNEIFDCWELAKKPADYHLLFKDWHEADLRAFVRRDRNHPSIMAWSYGNEVPEQYTGESGAELSAHLRDILREEDATRPSSASKNYARAFMPFPEVLDIINLNYQGSGIRDTPAYDGLQGIHRDPAYPEYHRTFPKKMILGSETASALSSRGIYLFPVTNYTSAPANGTSGTDPVMMVHSAYELYSAPPGSSADKVFTEQDRNPYVAGEFVWSGFDYLGEPFPYDGSRSSSYGIIDQAGFPKDRFWLYQSRWRPELKTAHILPHWTWPDRVGEITPVHVFSGANEAELFVNGQSKGRRTKGLYEYRFRWDEIVYEPGEVSVVTFKDGKPWAENTTYTAGNPAELKLTSDRAKIYADGHDLAFVTLEVTDSEGKLAPRANNTVEFSLSGPGKIIATDNGYAADFVAFPSLKRDAFSGLALAIARFDAGATDPITIRAAAKGLKGGKVTVEPL